jgi:hypothetical protein
MWAGHQIGSVPGHEATSVRWALEGLSIHQHASERAWPYGAPHWPAGRPVAALDSANRRALPSWRRPPSATFDDIRNELVLGHAVLVSLRVVLSAWRSSDGVIDAEAGRKAPANHAVLAVGVSEAGERGEQVIIKNSWGAGWGMDGYGFVAKRYIDHYGLRIHVLEREGNGTG